MAGAEVRVIEVHSGLGGLWEVGVPGRYFYPRRGLMAHCEVVVEIGAVLIKGVVVAVVVEVLMMMVNGGGGGGGEILSSDGEV